jgi:hypothetical protein
MAAAITLSSTQSSNGVISAVEIVCSFKSDETACCAEDRPVVQVNQVNAIRPG